MEDLSKNLEKEGGQFTIHVLEARNLWKASELKLKDLKPKSPFVSLQVAGDHIYHEAKGKSVKLTLDPSPKLNEVFVGTVSDISEPLIFKAADAGLIKDSCLGEGFVDLRVIPHGRPVDMWVPLKTGGTSYFEGKGWKLGSDEDKVEEAKEKLKEGKEKLKEKLEETTGKKPEQLVDKAKETVKSLGEDVKAKMDKNIDTEKAGPFTQAKEAVKAVKETLNEKAEKLREEDQGRSAVKTDSSEGKHEVVVGVRQRPVGEYYIEDVYNNRRCRCRARPTRIYSRRSCRCRASPSRIYSRRYRCRARPSRYG